MEQILYKRNSLYKPAGLICFLSLIQFFNEINQIPFSMDKGSASSVIKKLAFSKTV